MNRRSTDALTARVSAAIEQAAISGLCHDGQLEIAAQTVRELRSGLDRRAALALAVEIYDAMEK